METQASLDLSIDDILFLHRHWILKLYVEDRKSEEEIVSLLYERRLFVTLVKIHKCLKDWGAIPSPPPTAAANRHSSGSAQHPPPHHHHHHHQHQHPPHPPSPDQAITDHYKRRALPTIPFSRSTDRLKVTCHHGPSQSHEVETTLEFVPAGPSQLELYTTEDQSHERVAVGLERTPRSRRQGQGWSSSAQARPRDHHHHHRISRLGCTRGDKDKRKKHRRGGDGDGDEEEKKRDS